MIRVRQIKVEVTKEEDILKEEIAKKLRIPISDILDYQIQKQSLDARKKEEIYFVYEVDITILNEEDVLKKNKSIDVFKAPDTTYQIPKKGNLPLINKPIIVGSGPAGLLAAYLLSENNYNPIIIERGEKIEDRVKTVESFFETGILNENSNIQFGEGGAGTFSDGKLNTLVKDTFQRGKKVFEIFVSCGAPKEILYSYKPHIGTDLLREVVKNMREKIIEMGGTFLYNTCLTDIEIKDNMVKEIEINHEEKLPCDQLILAIGHSARDTFEMLFQKNIKMEAKAFAVGVRVQHPQKMIDASQYGEKYKDILSKASYKLTYKSSNGRGVYTFCMCPGGHVVNASSEENHLAINGMSNYARDTENANSAVVVTISPKDFGTHPLDGIHYQRALEKKAFEYGHGKIPVQLLTDFKNNKTSSSFKEVKPIFKGEYEFADLNQILPEEVSSSLKEAFPYFGKKIQGFDREDTILSAIESRTSSPVRIIRNEEYEANIKGIYPCGEGAGYAGGITSAGIDGIKVAEAIIQKYSSF